MHEGRCCFFPISHRCDTNLTNNFTVLCGLLEIWQKLDISSADLFIMFAEPCSRLGGNWRIHDILIIVCVFFFQGNVGPAAFWLLGYLLTNPEALKAVQREFGQMRHMETFRTTSTDRSVNTPVFGEEFIQSFYIVAYWKLMFNCNSCCVSFLSVFTFSPQTTVFMSLQLTMCHFKFKFAFKSFIFFSLVFCSLSIDPDLTPYITLHYYSQCKQQNYILYWQQTFFKSRKLLNHEGWVDQIDS